MKADKMFFHVAVALVCLPSALGFTEVRITDNPNIQIEPAIDGTRIVWQDNRNKTLDFVNPKNHWDIYAYDLTTGIERRITNNDKDQINPAIDGDWIVWEDDRMSTGFPGTNKEIYSYLLPNGPEAKVTQANFNQVKPGVSDGRAVWQDNRDAPTSGMDIYLYDLVAKTTTPLCTAPGDQTMPSISGHRVVWLDGRGDSLQIYLYNLNLSQERAITTAFSAKGAPVIRGNKIVWHDFRSGNLDIFLYDLSTETETRITSDPANQMYPAVSDVGIVWTDYRHDANGDLYFYEFATQREIPLVVDAYKQILPDISANRIVWIDCRNDQGDIYMLEYSPPGGADLAIRKAGLPEQSRVGDRIVYTIDVINYGPLEATSVSVIDELSSKVRLISATSNKGTCFEFAGDIVGGVASLAVGEGFRWTIVVDAVASGTIVNTATVEGNEEDPIAINNSAATTTRVAIYDKKSLGDGWYPQIAAAAAGFEHLTFTRDGENWIEHFGDPEFIAPISHLPDDIVYATNRSGRWVSQIVFDGTGHSDPLSIGNPHSYLKEAVNSALAPDAAGHAHIAYQVNKQENDVTGYPYNQYAQLWYTNNASGTWSEPEMIAEVQTYDRGDVQYDPIKGFPLGMWAIDLAVDPAGHAHASYMNTRGFAGLGHVVYLTNASGDWTSKTVALAYDYASLAVDSAGRAHLCYYGWDLVPGGDYYQGLGYRTNAPDGIWQTPEAVDPLWTGAQLEGMICEIAIDSLDRPQISFVDGQGQPRQDYWHAAKIDGAWQIQRVAIGPFASGHNQIATGPDHAAHIVYPDPETKDLMYANNAGGNWAIEMLAPQDTMNTYLHLFDLSVDPAGGVHFVYHNYKSGDLTVSSRRGLDSDSDGVGDAFEQGPDGSDPAYDGNGDGTPDAQQTHVASLTTYGNQGYVTLACPEGATLGNVEPQDNPSPDDAPADEDFVYDFIGFVLLDLPLGGSTTVTLTLPPDAAPTSYYKYGPTLDQPFAHWYEFMYDGQTGAQISGNVVTLHFTDGRRGDNDLSANGVIVDPGAVAMHHVCIVDLDDLVRFTNEWMLTLPAEWLTADLDGDGSVGLADFAILADHWMRPCPPYWPW